MKTSKIMLLTTILTLSMPVMAMAQLQQAPTTGQAQGNTQQGQILPNNLQVTAAPSQTTRSARIEGIQGQQLIEAEEIVRAARGDCRRIENATGTATTPQGRAERSTIYRQCLADKEAGTYSETKYAPQLGLGQGQSGQGQQGINQGQGLNIEQGLDRQEEQAPSQQQGQGQGIPPARTQTQQGGGTTGMR